MTKPRKPPSGPLAVPTAPLAALQAEGWGRPWGSALRHYIVAGRSLCGDWRYHSDVSVDRAAGELCERCRAAAALRASAR